ncbi:hypothetical protein [Nevskia ramosa]|uniref:hypothetical protein n=1 Tax=Nevskia ramosa TaxID=64002 RepID=UPI003D10B274
MKNLIPTATETLFNDAMRALGLTSDYALAKRLNWPQSDISAYRKGRQRMGVRKAYEFAVRTGIPLEEVARAIIEDEAVNKGSIKQPLRNAIGDNSVLSS